MKPGKATMPQKPWGMATAIGSLPFLDPKDAAGFVLNHLPRVPHWPQLPKRSREEGLVNQYAGPLLAHRLLDDSEDRLLFRNGEDHWEESLTAFYHKALSLEEASRENCFGLRKEQAPGFFAFLEALEKSPRRDTAFLKGQVTGPVTMGLQLSDRQGKPCFYDDQLRELLLESLALQALWQIRQLEVFGLPLIIFFDDPGLCSYGQSTTIGLSSRDITRSYAYLASRVQKAGALAGVHACAGVDWSLVLRAGLDIVSADVYNYFPSLLLSAEDLEPFLQKGGTLAWGLVPTDGGAARETAAGLWSLFSSCCRKLASRGVDPLLLEKQWLITPACGTGSLEKDEAKRVYCLLEEMSAHSP